MRRPGTEVKYPLTLAGAKYPFPETPEKAEQITRKLADVVRTNEDGTIKCEFSYFLKDGDFLQERHESVTLPLTEELEPFSYSKPTGDPLDPYEAPEIDADGNPKLRKGYRPVAIVRGAYRDPNHLYREDDAIVVIVATKDEEGKPKKGEDGNVIWETRYFPRKNIPAKTWTEALLKLKAAELDAEE